MRRFIVCGQPRTGQWMVATAINGHPAARCLGELCNPSNRKARHQLPADARVDVIWRRAFTRAPRGCRACGFILQRQHAAAPGALGFGIWDRLADDPECRVILLHRSNQLSRYVSNLVARKQRDFSQPRSTATVRVRLERLAADIDRYWQRLDRARQLFKHHQLLEIDYSRPAGWRERVRAFLDLGPGPLEPTTRKQERRELADVVQNWSELQGLPPYWLADDKARDPAAQDRQDAAEIAGPPKRADSPAQDEGRPAP